MYIVSCHLRSLGARPLLRVDADEPAIRRVVIGYAVILQCVDRLLESTRKKGQKEKQEDRQRERDRELEQVQ